MEPLSALSWGGIIWHVAIRFTPVWVALVITFAVSITYKRKLGLYGKLFDNTIGMIGIGLVMFWIYTALLAGLFDMIMTQDPLTALTGMNRIATCQMMPPLESAYSGSMFSPPQEMRLRGFR